MTREQAVARIAEAFQFALQADQGLSRVRQAGEVIEFRHLFE